MTKNSPLIVGVCGSARVGSFNQLVLDHALAHVQSLGARTQMIEMRGDTFPNYCEDLETRDGRPARLDEIRRLCVEADGFIMASPEYNGGPTGILKNFLDWVSRPSDAAPGIPFREKPVGLLSVSPGRLGGIKGIQCLRMILSHLGMHISGKEFAFAMAKANTKGGKITDDFMAKEVDAVAARLLELAQ
ncbi:NAD(P)H-dependent oxidoreductase [bacterium]|nr:NAD(P)H-dependent oxidoreductase [bacterium]